MADDGRSLLAALFLTWVLALPIGIYSAVRQYSLGDYTATFVGFIGLAVPNFLLALVVLYLGFTLFNANIGGLFSVELQDAPWSAAKVWDLCKHLPIPALILGLAGTAQQIRIMRANLLDELRKPYVVTARSKGLSELKVILKYPVRLALNPFASTDRLHAAVHRVGEHHRVPGPRIADRRTAPAAGPHLAGHVPGGDDRAPARRHDGDRHADLGHSPRVGRPAHPARGLLMAEPDVALDASAPAHGPGAVAPAEDRRLYVASQWQLTWWRFQRHRVAVASGIVVIGFYLVVLGADFLAYADPNASEAQRSLMPPQPIHWFEGWRFRPHVYAVKGVRDLQTFRRVYQADPAQKIPIRFFAEGFEYRFLGVIPATRHLIGVDGGARCRPVDLSAGHRSTGAGSVVAADVRHAHLAHRSD